MAGSIRPTAFHALVKVYVEITSEDESSNRPVLKLGACFFDANDHYLTPRDTLNFRYIFSEGNILDPLSTSGANVPGFPVGEEHRAQNFVATETHTFSPSLVGLARVSFLRNRFLFDEHVNHTTPASLGFQYAPSLDLSIGPPFIQVAGFASVGDPITGPRNT
jgi:hypothetical protein